MRKSRLHLPSHVTVAGFRRKILQWYRSHGRHDLPWRKNPTPYRVLVAEVMLQQTQVSRVAPKYKQFLRHYPSLKKLARANTRQLLRLWSGLGYNRRALLLRRCAEEAVQKFGGRLPDGYEDLRKLPCLGPYTAHAVNIFGRNRDEVCIDTNVRRVLTYELKLPRSLSDRKLETVAVMLLPRGRAREWHNALMDYGALVATSRKTAVKPRSKQGRFMGSNRYYRGQIVKLLLSGRMFSVPDIGRRLGVSEAKLRPLLVSLAREGIVDVNHSQVHVST